MENPRDYLDPKVLSKIDSLELIAKFIVEGFMLGLHRSPYHGFSVEFSSYRKYSPGDELKFVDWRVFARTDKFYVKQFEETTNLNCYLALDLSGSMGMADDGVSKAEYAKYVAAGLAYLMLKQGDAVGLATFGAEQFNIIPPSGRLNHLYVVLRQLLDAKPGGKTDLGRQMALLGQHVRGRSLVVLVSDLLIPANEFAEAVRFFRYRGHEVIVFHVLTPLELAFPYQKQTNFLDMEDGRSVLTEPGMIRTEYLRLLREHIEGLKDVCIEQDCDFLSLSTSDDLGPILMTYLARRAAYV